MLAAEINALYAQGEEKLRTQCRKWQDSAANFIYRGKIEEDETYLWFTLYSVHHERAKTLAHFSLFHVTDDDLIERLKDKYVRADAEMTKDAHGALSVAGQHLDSVRQTGAMDYAITEARILLISREFEESAKSAKRALQIAHAVHSQQGITNVRKVYKILNALVPQNPYIRNLAIELGIY